MAKILIVDDSRTSRRILRTLMEENGYTVVGEAANGKEGYDMCKDLEPDVVTMDITMPIMDGLESLRLIKQYRKGIIVIMVTAAGQQNKVMEAIKSGAADFITKPFEPDRVVKTVFNLINK